jgi:replication factor A1
MQSSTNNSIGQQVTYNPYAGDVVKRHADPGVTPISSLSPYGGGWTIEARCVSKTDVKTWTNARGEGKLFSVTLLDATGDIRVTGFNETCSLFYEAFQVGQAYRLSRAAVKLTRKQFGGASNAYEIHLEKDSLVVPLGDPGALPGIQYAFHRVQAISNLQKDDVVDVIGVVTERGDLVQITSKATQKQLVKRDIVLADDSGCAIRVTLWGRQAEDAVPEANGRRTDWAGEPLIAIKGAKVSDYNGRTLSVSANTLLHLNPDIPEAHSLRGWYDTLGVTSHFHNLSAGALPSTSSGGDEKPSARLQDRCLLNDIKTEQLGATDKADYIDVLATISFIKSDGAISYAACRGTSDGGAACQKKVTEIGPNLFRCEKCARNYDAPQHRYIFSLNVSDCSGQTWLNAFNEAGQVIFGGKAAQDLIDIKDADLTAFQKIVREACFQRYLFRLRIKNEIYQGESKSRASIISLAKPDYSKETRMVLDWLIENPI